MVWGSYLYFFGWVLSCKWGQAIRNLVGINCILNFLGLVLQRWWFGFLNWLLQKLWVRVLFSYFVLDNVHLYVQILTALFLFNTEPFPFFQSFPLSIPQSFHFRTHHSLNLQACCPAALSSPALKTKKVAFFLFFFLHT